ncbi:MAG TPA: ABC transporter permease, partial [Vicinamibacterales bacterium]
SRARLVRQMLVESLLLAGAGTLAGAAGALGMLKLAIASAPVAIPRLAHVTPDLRLLGFALAVVGGTAIAFGLLPALVLARTDATDALKHGSRGTTGVRGHRWNRLLVVAEVALACAVLVASALLVRSVTRMIAAPIGVVADGVVTGTLQVNSTAYRDWPSVAQFYDTLLTSIRQQPGVEAAGASNAIPLEAGWRLSFTIEGRPAPSPADRPVVQHVSITPGYLEAFRATVTSGRALAASDRRDTEPVVIVNESFAKKFFPGESAVGRRLVADSVQIGPLGRNLPGRVPFRIVGVVADLHQAPLGQAPEPVVYNAVDQFPFRAMTVVVRGADVATVSSAIRTSLHALDPTMPVSGLKTIHARVLDHTAAPRLLMFVLTAFALLTGVLAAIGVYGLLACVVTERRRELAIRLALGAQPSALAAMVTRQGLLLTSIGIVAGVCAAQLAGTALTRVLFETRPTDAVALIAAAGLLLAATLVACVPPAIRAARVEPVDGLRGDG